MSRSHRARPASLLAAGGSLVVGLVLSATPGAAAAAIPGVDEERSSGNVTRIANIPKSAPLDATNSDLAFQGDYAFQGNYNGFNVIDISKPSRPKVVTSVLCPGSQNDVSVYGDLLFLSTDSRRADDSCSTTASTTDPVNYWEGIKIFDISDVRHPTYLKSVETMCGSHTHTLAPAKDGKNVYVYVSSYDVNETLADCKPPHDLISIIKVPVKKPTAAAVISTPVLFPDGGNPGDPLETPFPFGTRPTTGCHDITVFPEKDLAAGACMGDGVLWDISDRTRLVEIDRVQDDEFFAFWHSATFNNAGTKVVFTDELGGGGAATCVPEMDPRRGADGIYDIEGRGMDRELVFKSYYKIPRINAASENCVAHNGSLVPVKGRDIMVQSWYMGGVSVWDFTDSANPKEIGFWERGPVAAGDPTGGGTWSAYWYNGHVFSSDLGKGFDVLRLTGKEFAGAKNVRYDELNVQSQPVFSRGR